MMQWLGRKYYHYNLWTGLYMLDWWERLLYSKSAAYIRKPGAAAGTVLEMVKLQY